MIVAPRLDEWLWIYGPLAIALLLAIGIELRTGRIPNLLTYPLFLYLLSARMVLGPETPWRYLTSVLLAVVLVVGLGWSRRALGGGLAKLTVAASAALLPWMILVICGIPLLIALAMAACRRPWRTRRLPGSVVLTLLTAGVVAVAALAGRNV